MQMMGLLSGQVNGGKTLTSDSGKMSNKDKGFSTVISEMMTGGSGDDVKSLLKGEEGLNRLNSTGEKELVSKLKQLLEEIDANIKQVLKDALSFKNEMSTHGPGNDMTEDEVLANLLNKASSEELSVLGKLFSDNNKVTDANGTDHLASLLDKLETIIKESENTVSGEWKDLISKMNDLIKSSGDKQDNFLNQILTGASFPVDSQKAFVSPENRTGSTQGKLENLFQNFQQILRSAGEGKQLTNDQLKQVKEILMSYAKTSDGKSTATSLENFSGTKEEKALFQQLISNVNRKQQMPSAYNQQQISVKDISKWMAQATSNLTSEEVNGKQVGSEQKTTLAYQTPMTRVEQLVIKVDQQSSTPAQKQVFQQMQGMIQSSRMFTDKAGNQEMQIKLKPASLGEMTIKFTQLSGEMAVKIMVTSQAAKEMLEGNMQQLRHMFSPQQVVVEKTDQSLSQQFLSEEEAETSGEKEDTSSEQNLEEDGEDEENGSDTLSFSDILNEKV
ncbi:hook-length control protein FliK [Salimicrobium flavidum]|uniref:Hook-length control protein FliK n=1 Tax=Salimicrobium flavidum TaxID=570947 RepID=A0A1N7IKM7_9BACI|nr:hook-length control protein FliK [Salimicrobium flavidum]